MQGNGMGEKCTDSAAEVDLGCIRSTTAWVPAPGQHWRIASAQTQQGSSAPGTAPTTGSPPSGWSVSAGALPGVNFCQLAHVLWREIGWPGMEGGP